MNRAPVAGVLLASALALTARPASAGTLGGRVLVDGKPAGGATVSALPFEEPLERARREARSGGEAKALATVTAGPDGAFALSVPPAPGKEVLFRVRFAAKGAVGGELGGVYDASEADDLGEIPLAKGEALAGRVTGPGGKPVAGARVSLTARGRFDASSGLSPVPQEATTGADGTFRFESAASEGNELVVTATGLAPARVEAAKRGAQPRSVVLAAPAALSGSVKRRDGTPAAGVLVRYEGSGLETRWVETGADGTFRLADIPARHGAVVADAGDDGFAEAASVTPGPGRPPVALTLAPPTVLEGRTLDVATLKAVPRVRLRIGDGERLRVARSGADGRYRVRGLRPGAWNVRADEPRYVLWTRHNVALEKGTAKTLDVPLTRGASLAGRVVDEDGRPVADAHVAVSPGEDDVVALVSRALSGDPGARVRSRADGTFAASRLAPGENRRLTVNHPDFEKGTLGGISLVSGETRAGALVRLRRGLLVTGTVKDPEGNAIAGVEVSLMSSGVVRSARGGRMTRMSFGGFSELPSARSGADGRFELKGVPAGTWALTAKSPGRATETVDPLKLVRDTRPEPVALVLAPGAAISGAVVRRTGEGAGGHSVMVRPSGRPMAGGIRVDMMNATGSDGTFFIDGLKAGETYDLQLFGGLNVIGPGPTKKGIVAPSMDIKWVIEGAGRIEGTAVDARTGQPLTSFEVSFHPDRPGFGGGGVMRVGRRAGSRAFGGAGESILVEASDGRFALEDVPAGRWQVVVTAKGYQAGRAGGVVVEEATTTDGVEIRVPGGTVLRGRVADARTNRGVPEADVSVSADASPSFLGFGPLSGLVTDVDGRFEVEGLAPGKVSVAVSHPDYTGRTETVELKEGGGSVEVALSRGGSLGGVVVSETRQPVTGAEVSLDGSGGAGRGFGGESAATDASGRFRFDHLSAGRYTLHASVPGQTSAPVEAVVVAGESRDDVALVLSGGATIRGGVSGLPDALRVGVNVIASGPAEYWATARTGADGRFELAGAPPGTVTLRAVAGDPLAGSTRSATGSVAIAEGQKEAETEIVFEGNGVLSGRVTRGGQPAADARITAGTSRGGPGASARSDEGGAYRIEGLTPGDYVVYAMDGIGMAPRVSKSIRIDGEASLDFDLPLARFSGTVVDGATKQPLADARVAASLDGKPGARPGSATTDSNGRFFVDDVEPGSYTLTLRRSGYQEAHADATATEAGGDAGTIEMTRGEGLELVVRDGIYQIPLRAVSVRAKDGAGMTVLSTFVSLDDDGKGEIPSLKPGRYTLVVESGGYATQVLDGIVVPGAPLPVALTPGGSVEVRPGEASRAKGAALLRNAIGQPHPYRAWGPEGRVPIPAAGPAVVDHLAPGSYTLGADGVAPKGFTVTEGARTVVDLP